MASTMDPAESVAFSDVDSQMCENLEAVPPKKSTKKRGSKKKSKKKNYTETSDAGGDDELFHVISNPEKMLPKPRKTSHKSGRKKKKKNAPSVRSMSSLSDSSDDGKMMSSIGPNSFRSHESFGGSIGYAEQASAEDNEGYADDGGQFNRRRRSEEVMQEKVEMLTRISKMSKQGFAVTKRWTVRDDIDEIRFECYRMTRESNSKKAVKSMQHGLITLATILEFANSVLNPFNLKLQGFSRNMMLTVSDYDDSLEAIHHKWSGKTSIGPELTVLFTFATSAVFHHAGNVSNNSSPPTSRHQNTNKTGGGMGLGDMSSMLALFSNIVPKGGGSGASTEQTTAKAVTGDQKQKQRRPMKGPTTTMPSASMSLP